MPANTTTLIALPVLFSSGDPTRDVLTASSLITTPQVATVAATMLPQVPPPTRCSAASARRRWAKSNLVAVTASASSAARAQQIANAFPQAVITTRAAALHKAISAIIPGLQAQAAKLPRALRGQPGTVSDQLSQLETLSNSPDPTMTLAAPAVRPTAPYTPKVKLSLAAGLFGGLILGIALAFAYQALDPRLRREEAACESCSGFRSWPRSRASAAGAGRAARCSRPSSHSAPSRGIERCARCWSRGPAAAPGPT